MTASAPLHPRLAIPGLMRYIVGANIVTYFLDLLSQGGLSFLAMSPAAVLHGEVWADRHLRAPATSGGIWLLLSCLFYYWLGETLERIWGSAKFTVYYLSGTLFDGSGVHFGLSDRRYLRTGLWGYLRQHRPVLRLRPVQP